MPEVAALLTCCGIAFLFWLDHGEARISHWNWVPTLWLLIFCSRPVTSWMTMSGPGNAGDAYLDGSPIDRAVLTSLMVLGLLALYKRSGRAVAVLRCNGPLLLFFGFCALSAAWSDYPGVVLKRWMRSLGDIEMILVIVTDPNWKEALRRILMRLGYVLLPLSILFIRFYPSLGRAYSVAGAPMWTGVSTDKNALGATCMLVGAALLWRWMTIFKDQTTLSRMRQLTTIVILYSMVLYLVFIVNSQTALACFLMAAILIATTAIRMVRRPVVVSLLAGSMFGAAYSVLFLGLGKGALETMGRDASLTGRTEVWQAVLPYEVNPWVGAGYENFWIGERLEEIGEAVGQGLNQAHNGYIELYLNIGWVGLTLLGVVVVTGYGNVIRGLRADPEMARLKLAYFFVCMVYNFTEAAFKMNSPVWILFIWAAMGYPRPRARRTSSPTYVPELEESAVGWG